MVVTELIKKRTNAGLTINLYYWRDKTGHEIDIIVDEGGELLPIEIKSGKTINTEFFKNIDYWSKLSNTERSILLYAGEPSQKRSNGKEILNWRSLIAKDF
jgi:predicted AAA+ superfamily ATPase